MAENQLYQFKLRLKLRLNSSNRKYYTKYPVHYLQTGFPITTLPLVAYLFKMYLSLNNYYCVISLKCNIYSTVCSSYFITVIVY